jgi:Ca-activated chloride channel family protein
VSARTAYSDRIPRAQLARIDSANRASYDGVSVFKNSIFPGRRADLLLCFFLVLPLVSAKFPTKQPAARATGSTVAEISAPKDAQVAAPDNVVTLFVSATDEKGLAVSDLVPAEIYLSEDKVEQKIESFVLDSSTPVVIAVLIDMSGSRRDEKSRQAEHAALSEFLHTALRNVDTAGILVFNDEIFVLTELTSDIHEFDRVLHEIAKYQPHGATALFDAIFSAAGARIPGRSGHRALLVLSDFDDNASRHSSTEAIQAAQRTQSSIYCLVDQMMPEAKASKRGARRPPQSAEKLSKQTGGEALVFDSQQSMASAFEWVKAHLHDAYVLRYRTTNSAHDGKFHKLRLETTRKGVRLGVANAYFARKN